MQRILLLNTALDIGGAERVVASLARGMKARDRSVVVGTLKKKGSIGSVLEEEGIEVVTLSGEPGRFAKYTAFRRIATLIKERGIQIVHSHGSASLWEGALAKYLVPSARLIHTFHFGNYPHQRWQNKILERIGGRRASKLVAVGYRQRAAIAKSYGIREADIDVILNGVDEVPAIDDMRSRIRGSASPQVVIGSVSTLIEQKGIEVLLRAAKILKDRELDFRLVIVGEGPLREALELQVEIDGLADIVEFIGWIDEAASRVLPVIDVFVQPSRWEAMSIVILEAMAAGLPIVATDVGDNGRVIENGKSGLIVHPENHDELAETLALLISDETVRIGLGKGAQERQSAKYSEAAMMDSYLSVYRSAMEIK